MRNKRGQSMSTSTVILLILGLVILVVLIIGFATGWKAFKNKIQPTNVDDIISECNSICGLNQQFSYCSGDRTLRVTEDNLEVSTSCAVLAASPDFKKYGFVTCPSISCDLKCEDVTINSKKGSPTLTSGYDVSGLVGGNCFVPKSK